MIKEFTKSPLRKVVVLLWVFAIINIVVGTAVVIADTKLNHEDDYNQIKDQANSVTSTAQASLDEPLSTLIWPFAFVAGLLAKFGVYLGDWHTYTVLAHSKLIVFAWGIPTAYYIYKAGEQRWFEPRGKET